MSLRRGRGGRKRGVGTTHWVGREEGEKREGRGGAGEGGAISRGILPRDVRSERITLSVTRSSRSRLLPWPATAVAGLLPQDNYVSVTPSPLPVTVPRAIEAE